uniref:condensation domain-containing protein n=1 Tax=Paenibacillus polymyxa TaxID=1406 RepID=UPI00215BAE86|nr:condensation domain-containing protein [Paenibacillus polymyxa]
MRIQYKDYAVWQQSEAHQEWMQRQEAYWLDTFQGELPVLDLSTDFARPAVQSTAGDTIEFVLEHEVSERLKELAAQTGATLYMVLLAAYTTLLHKYTGQEDIVVGTPIAGRPHAELRSGRCIHQHAGDAQLSVQRQVVPGLSAGGQRACAPCV